MRTGLWRLVGDAVVALDPEWPGPLTVLVPSEQATSLVVRLPMVSRAGRAAAAPFAVEPLIAEPLDRVHVALGTEVVAGSHVCAVVAHEVMRRWVAIIETAELSACVMTPDALSLALPPSDAWRIFISGDRAVVRTGDGAGFAAETAMLPALWASAGEPALIADGDPLPEALIAGARLVQDLALGGAAVAVPPVDLRQGPYARPRTSTWNPWRSAAAILVAGAAAHLVLAGLDLAALHFMAERREAETRALVAARDGALAREPDLVAAVDRLAPEARSVDGPLTRTLARLGAALDGRPLAFRALTWDGGAGSARLAVTASDMAQVEAATAGLRRGGLMASATGDAAASGPSSADGIDAVITVEGEGGAE